MPKVGLYSVIRIVTIVILDSRATIKVIPYIVVRINFSSAPRASDETSIGVTNMLDRFLYIKILIVFHAYESLHVETYI